MQSETYNHYWQKGWAVAENVFSREEVDLIAEIALDVSTQEMRESEDSYVVDASSEGETAPAQDRHAFPQTDRISGLRDGPAAYEIGGADAGRAAVAVGRPGIHEAAALRFGQAPTTRTTSTSNATPAIM